VKKEKHFRLEVVVAEPGGRERWDRLQVFHLITRTSRLSIFWYTTTGRIRKGLEVIGRARKLRGTPAWTPRTGAGFITCGFPRVPEEKKIADRPRKADGAFQTGERPEKGPGDSPCQRKPGNFHAGGIFPGTGDGSLRVYYGVGAQTTFLSGIEIGRRRAGKPLLRKKKKTRFFWGEGVAKTIFTSQNQRKKTAPH